MWLMRNGFSVVPISREFNRAQQARFGERAISCPITELSGAALAQMFITHKIDIVVNCVGILQDGCCGSTAVVHQGFVASLIGALVKTVPAMVLMLVGLAVLENR